MKTNEQLKKIVNEHFKIPVDIQRRANIATLDLYFGPYSADNLESDELEVYPSFGEAVDKIKEWTAENIPSEIWIDLDCDYVQTSEPKGYQDEESGEWIEPYLENTWHLEHRDILRALFDKELVSYL